jgi:Fe-S cluster assembly ATP-binding protein
MVKLQQVSIARGKNVVIDQFSMQIDPGSFVLLTGPNGVGKTTLLQALMGVDDSLIITGKMIWDGIDITTLSVEQRALRGMFLAYQTPPRITGVSIRVFLTHLSRLYSNTQQETGDWLITLCAQVGLPIELLDHEMNHGLSVGQIKRLELMQLLIMQPKLIMLDELDAGLDEAGKRILVDSLCALYTDNKSRIFIITTHNPDIYTAIENSTIENSGIEKIGAPVSRIIW